MASHVILIASIRFHNTTLSENLRTVAPTTQKNRMHVYRERQKLTNFKREEILRMAIQIGKETLNIKLTVLSLQII